MKTIDLIGDDLDLVVEQIEEPAELIYTFGRSPYHPSTDWSVGGLIIDREKIAVSPALKGKAWVAHLPRLPTSRQCFSVGPTPLIAAMRCYIASVLGDVVEVPCR